MNKLLNTHFWNEAWDKYFDHYQQDPRHVYYINAFLNDDEQKILEIAAGSFRDFNILNSVGKNCYAFDYCKNAVNKAKKMFPNLQNKILCKMLSQLPIRTKNLTLPIIMVLGIF